MAFVEIKLTHQGRENMSREQEEGMAKTGARPLRRPQLWRTTITAIQIMD